MILRFGNSRVKKSLILSSKPSNQTLSNACCYTLSRTLDKTSRRLIDLQDDT